MKFDSVCFGALNVDKLYLVDEIPVPGQETFVREVKEFPGGSAANTAVGLARLGARTGYIGKVADDQEGRLHLNEFRRENVDTHGIVISKQGRSGEVIGFVDKKGERTLIVNPGVNDTLGFGEINLIYASSAKFLHLTSFVCRHSESPFEAQKELVKSLKDTRISFDPGELYVNRGLEALRPIIRRSYVVFPNEKELKKLTKEEAYTDGAKRLLKEGAEIVTVKLGERGCYVTDGYESHTVEPSKVKVVDTTGAGDAFCAGFLHGLMRGADLYGCCRAGNYVASRKIRMHGAREGLPNKLSESD